jgi:hypothetical protein
VDRSATDEPVALKILSLRGEIAELGGAIRQLQRSGLDSAPAQLLITRKRGELECLMNRENGAKPKRIGRPRTRDDGD